MTKGAVYHHFPTKADLFIALAEQRLGGRHATVAEELESALGADDPPPLLARLVKRYVESAREDPGYARLWLEVMAERREERVKAAAGRAHREPAARVAEAARRLQRAGRVSERVDPDAFALLWLAVIEGLLLLSVADPAIVEPGKVAPNLVDLLWNGMKRRYGGR
jgi:AcrR family transcriptional regulator